MDMRRLESRLEETLDVIGDVVQEFIRDVRQDGYARVSRRALRSAEPFRSQGREYGPPCLSSKQNYMGKQAIKYTNNTLANL